MTTYTIERAHFPIEKKLIDFLVCEVPKINGLFGDTYNLDKADLRSVLDNYIFTYCLRDGEVTGILIAYLGASPFDRSTKILRQVLFYVKPESGRTAYHLFKNFIDIGKLQANHIITMLTRQTNIKPETLKRLGFSELETLYRLEVEGEPRYI